MGTPGPQGFGRDKRRRNLEILGLVALLVLVVLGARACLGYSADLLARNLPYSIDAKIGETAAEQMRAQYNLGKQPSEAQKERVQRIFDELLDSLAPADREVLSQPRVTVVVDDTPNAFALPGGEVFVLTGLLDRVGDDDAQLRGVLAHELGHAVKRHGLRNLARSAALGIVLSLVLGTDDFMTTLIAGAAHLDSLSYSRGMESEADAFGTELMLKTGHDVEGLARFLESLGRQPVPELLSTHPDPAERAEEIRARAREQ